MKRTLKEWAEIMNRPVAIDENRSVFAFDATPFCRDVSWRLLAGSYYKIPKDLVDYKGDWKDSLTLPPEPPFKVGELVIFNDGACVDLYLTVCKVNNDTITPLSGARILKQLCRRPTKEEWKVLRGES